MTIDVTKPFKTERGKVPALTPGTMYRIRYRQQTGNYTWREMEAVAQFLGQHKITDKVAFSFRPDAGTTEFDADQILEAYSMPRSAHAKLPRRVGAYHPEGL